MSHEIWETCPHCGKEYDATSTGMYARIADMTAKKTSGFVTLIKMAIAIFAAFFENVI